MVNPDVDGYIKTLNHRKILRKTRKTTTYCKRKEYWNRSVSYVWARFNIQLARGSDSPLCPPFSYVTGNHSRGCCD